MRWTVFLSIFALRKRCIILLCCQDRFSVAMRPFLPSRSRNAALGACYGTGALVSPQVPELEELYTSNPNLALRDIARVTR